MTRFYRLLDSVSDECLPQYAVKPKRFALVILEVAGRKLFYLKYIEYFIMHFDSKGCIDDKEHQRRVFLTVQSVPPIFKREQPDSSIIDAEREFRKKQFDREFKWQPTPEIENAIEIEIFRHTSGPTA
jgi:hypothetical protein